MSLTPALLNVCLLAEGFPQDICPAEVAKIVLSKTGVAVRKIAPWTTDTDNTTAWLLYLLSHEDQKKCLLKFRRFSIPYGNGQQEIQLDFPGLLSFTPRELDWVVVNEEEERMDSVASDDMFGEGDVGSPADSGRRRTEGGVPEPGGAYNYQEPGFHWQPGPQQTVGQGPAWHGQPPQGAFAQPHPHQRPDYPGNPQGQPPRSGPNLIDFNPDPHFSSNPGSHNVGRGLKHPEPQAPFQGYPKHPFPGPSMGRGQSMFPQPEQPHHPGMYAGVPAYDSNPAYPTTGASQGGTGALQERMGELNLRHEPFPHHESFEHQPENFYGDNMGPDGFDDQSDFVVLDPSGSGPRPELHHHFFLRVTQLPVPITEQELWFFFENRKQSGGGPVSKMNLNQSARSADVYFTDPEVIDRVLQKAPLLLKEKKICVEAVTAEHEEAEAEIRTVEIRGLQTEDETEMCMYYFENPAKGGGDVEVSNWNDEEKIFYITFEDSEVAKRVASQGHKLGSKVLEVALYTPPAEETDDGQPQCTVEVRGIDPTNMELYEFYFSNPKKGGDTIVDLHLSDDKTVLYITFETPEVAERVATMSHQVGGRQLQVMVAVPEDPTPPSTVMVRGCDLDNEELYKFYFENTKKGGGDITDYVVDKEQQAILITFQDPEVAATVITKPHKVGGQNLELSMYIPKKATPQRQKSVEPAEEEKEAPLKTVVVAVGQHPLESEDTYSLYFESRRGGAGEVDAVEIDEEKKLVYVTFADSSVAARVAERQHKIMGRSVEVTLYIPPKPKPTYPDKLLFKNVADSTTRDCLSMYLERVTGLEPQEVLYGDEVGTVLVTFEEEPDLEKTQQFLKKKKLEGRPLTVSKVPITNCILVENLNEATTENTVEFYFENKRSKGGPVEKVEMVPKENKCFVFFEDHEVLDGVLSKQHKLDGAQLVVKRYMECLGQSGGSEDPTAFTMPKPLVLDSIDPYKVAFLRQNQSAKSGLLQQLSSTHAKAKFEGDRVILECSLALTVPKARILARTWAVDVRQMAESYFAVIAVHKRDVIQQLWEEVEKAVNTADISSPEGAVMFTVKEEAAFVVVGMKSMAEELFNKIVAVIRAKEEDIERKNQEVTETNTKMQHYQLRLLLAMSFQVEAGKRYNGLRIDISLKKNVIVFHGLLKDVKQAQVDMYEVLQTVTSDRMKDLTDMQKKVLDSKETKPYIVQKFKNENISAVWELGQKDVMVYAFSDAFLVKAIHIIRKSIPEHVCQLSSESSELLSSRDWESLVKQLTSANPGNLLIAPAHDNQRVFITSIDSIMHGTIEEVDKFLEENTVYSQVVRFSTSRQLFLQENWQRRLLDIQSSLQVYRVQITTRDGGGEFYVKGTNLGLIDLRKRLEAINQEIFCHVETFTDPAKVKFLSSKQIGKDLRLLSQGNHCVMALEPEAADLQVVQAGSHGGVKAAYDTSSVQTSASVQLPNGVTISAVQGDITQLPVDAIVNAANNRMDHIGGLAKDIVEKGGPAIQEECYRMMKTMGNQLTEGDVLMTGSGRLPCKAVIHAIGPIFRGGHSGEEDCLHETVMKCMLTATQAGFSSIAIPAISTGIFRYPAKEAARVITGAVKTYFESHRKSSVQTVYLCHLTSDIVQMFSRAVQKAFPSARSTSTVMRKPVPVPRNGSRGTAGAVGGGVASGHKVINVSIKPGEIAKQTADVIINSTSNGLDLQNGAVSSSILRVAGQGLQDECRLNYPKGIQTGEIAGTRGYGLSCKEVYHIALCNWSNPNAQQVLEGAVAACLTEASKQHHDSIAFPVLGTGNLGYPANIVAQAMLGAIDQFQQNTPSTSLRSASIVIYPKDTKNLKEFRDVQNMFGGSGGGMAFPVPQTSAKSTGNRQSRRFSKTGNDQQKSSSQAASDSRTNAVFEIGDVKFIIKQGDITEEKVEAIVNSSNSNLDLSRGNVAGALKSKCGPELVRECASKVEEMKRKGIVITKAYKLPCKRILHINAEQFSSDWKEAFMLCLKEAENLGVRTLALPALGTGAYGQTPAQSAADLFRTVTKFLASKPQNLHELRVVLFDIRMIPSFVSAVESLGNKFSQQNSGGIMNWFKSVVTGSSGPSVKQTFSAPVLEEATLYIYTGNRKDIPEILKAFDDLVKDRFLRKEINDEALLTLTSGEVARIKQLENQYKVEITVQPVRGRVIIDGLQPDIFEAMQEISKILREVERKKQEAQSASMLANMVQWSFLEVTNTGTESKEYAQRENHIIEVAYQGKKKTADLVDADGNVFVVDFDSMMEYPKDDPIDTVGVLRRDKIRDLASGSVPDNWTDHSASEHVKVVAVLSTDPEYKKVEANFRATLGANRGNLTIVSIDRIQNRTLYQQYAAKKAHLEKQNTGIENEKTLWHGTASDALENINNYGFNRSYCGKNATVYGQGVYFAVNTNYSTHPTYSPPDPSGNRRIYQCKVLVGHATVGNQAVRVLPARSGPILYDSATDNPNNPQMYVIFNDTQAYPEYMITFK